MNHKTEFRKPMTEKMPTMKPSILKKSYLCLGDLATEKSLPSQFMKKLGRGKIPSEVGLHH